VNYLKSKLKQGYNLIGWNGVEIEGKSRTGSIA
jgi:hypothetical protein